MAHAHADVTIDAPIDLVWTVMLDTAAYPEWNPFVVEIGLPAGRPPQLGDVLDLHVRWSDGKGTAAHETVTGLDAPEASDGASALLQYAFGGPIARLGLVRGLRNQELTRLDDDTTRYVTHETLTGLASRFAPIAKVQDGFERHARALKARAESLRSA